MYAAWYIDLCRYFLFILKVRKIVDFVVAPQEWSIVASINKTMTKVK